MLVRFLFLLVCIGSFRLTAEGQDETSPPLIANEPAATTPMDGLTVEEAAKELEAFQKLEGQEALKEKAVPILSQIVKFLQDEKALQADTKNFKTDPQSIAKQADEQRRQLDARADDPSEAVSKMNDSEALRQELTKARQEFSDYQSQLDQLTLRLQTREKRRELIPAEKAAVEKRLEELKQPLPKPTEGEPPELQPLREKLARAEQQMLLQQREKLNLEPAYYDANAELRSLERQVLQRKLTASQRKVDLLQKRLDEVVKAEARASADRAEQTILDVPEELTELANEVAAIAKKRTSTDGPLHKAERLKELRDEADRELERIQRERAATAKRMENTFKNETIGEIIDSQRVDLPNVHQYEQRAYLHSRAVTDARERKAEIEAEITDLADLEDDITAALESLKLDDASWLEDDVRSLLQKKREYLTSLSADYENYRVLSDELAQREAELVNVINEYQKELDAYSMWVPVSDIYSLTDLKDAIAAIPSFFQGADWWSLIIAVWEEVQQNPIYFLVLAAALIGFLVLHARLKIQLNDASQEVSQGYLANFSYTWDAFLLSMVLACWIPLLIGVVGYRLRSVTRGTGFVQGIGSSLLACALVIGILRVIQYLVRGNGLGPVHFRWAKERTTSIRLHLHWYTLIVIPLTFFSALVQSTGDHHVHESLGRLLLMSGLLLAAFFLYKTLAPIRSTDERTPPPRLTFWQKVVTYGPCLIPLVFALMAFAGYTYTAEVLTRRLMVSVAVLLVLTVINEILSRWLYIARGRLALDQAKKRQEAREAEEAARAEGRGETSESPKAFDPKSAGIDLSQVNAQTRQLLTTTFRLAVFASLWLIWNDVVPPIGVLDYQLWQTNQLVESAAKVVPTNGDAVTTIVDKVNRWITVGDLLFFALLLVVTSIASKNLPGLLEITVLQNLPLDTGIRYAAGMLARYVLIAIGIIVATGFLGIGITQVSILLGGLAVGLGFGLQELFANFVSGIILLFEQPLRIGDVVTVGNVTGTVTRIRIRATTITDWDRKEYIVPNKEFITGQFMNWTLTDAINRLVIPVGIAYGADTEKARDILLRICERHPLVMDDPAPSAVFDGFGASTLNLTLRCFLENLDNRLTVTHDLHTAIDREFKRAGLEIAFPQLDLHLRTIDRGLSPIPVLQSNGAPVAGEKK